LAKAKEMKTSIDHLPADKQAGLQRIVQAINHRLPAEMIILFGSFARGDWVEDRYKENGTTYEYRSDFDILVVLNTEILAIRNENSKRWQTKLRRDTGKETPLNIIFHGIDYLNTEIEEGNYFFIDLLNEGIMLYDKGNFKLSAPRQLSPKERKNKAQRYFDRWFENAREFHDDFERNFELKRYSLAAFMLHQTVERFYMCLLLVYMDYKPKEHDLEKLDRLACRADNRFKSIFPRKTLEEERLFTLLKKAYIDSRYKLDYRISMEDLKYLSERVIKLRDLTELACKEKIEQYK